MNALMEPHVYHMGRFVQIVYCAMGLAFIGAGVFFLYMFGPGAVIVAVPISLPGIYCCCWALRSRLMLTNTEISVGYAFGDSSVQLSEVEGWRTEPGGRGGPDWVLQLRDNSGEFRIDQKFAVDDFFQDFLSKLRNLNETEISIVP